MKTSPRHNFAISNTNVLMIIFSVYRITLKILDNFPRLDTRVKNYHEALETTIIKATEVTKLTPLIMLQNMKVKNLRSRSLLDLLIETKVYSFMQVTLVESAINVLWEGKNNFDAPFMHHSTAY